MMAGPATVVSSLTVLSELVRTTYVCPAKPSGIATLKPPSEGLASTKTGPVTAMNAAYRVPSVLA